VSQEERGGIDTGTHHSFGPDLPGKKKIIPQKFYINFIYLQLFFLGRGGKVKKVIHSSRQHITSY